MLQVMTKRQIQQQNKELLQWVKDVLKGEYGINIANLLFALKQLSDAIKREKQAKTNETEQE